MCRRCQVAGPTTKYKCPARGLITRTGLESTLRHTQIPRMNMINMIHSPMRSPSTSKVHTSATEREIPSPTSGLERIPAHRQYVNTEREIPSPTSGLERIPALRTSRRHKAKAMLWGMNLTGCQILLMMNLRRKRNQSPQEQQCGMQCWMADEEALREQNA